MSRSTRLLSPRARRLGAALAAGLALAAAGPLRAQPAPDAPSVDFRHGPLRVAADGRHLVHADGTAFFWLGDTAWELFHRLTREEADLYLDDRRRKGFTVIQAVVLAEYGGLDVPNPYGDLPLTTLDPARPNEAYFRHVDYVVDAAARRGMYVGLLPTWGDKFNRKWGTGPEIFTPENARAYGAYLGRRYHDKPVVWILGGDRSPERPEHLAVIRAMAEGLRAGDGGTHLITYHPQGGQSSAQYFHADPWLALDMFQSGHGRRDVPNDRMVDAARALRPPKPVVDGEPRYEDHPIDWKPANGWFDAADVRQAAYWAVLAGAAGHTYGDHNVWQMWQPGRAPVSSARTPWRAALDHPGAQQMGYLRRLFESRDFLALEPDQGLLASTPAGAAADSGAGHPRAARARDGSYALAYTPLGRPLVVRLDPLRGPAVRAQWFDPRTGRTTPAGTLAARGTHTFDPPGAEGRGRDWVLVLDGTTQTANRPAPAALAPPARDTAPRAPDNPCASSSGWNTPQPPFRVYGNTYYVGTRCLSAVLVTSPAGHVLIDAGLPTSAPLVLANIQALGFRAADVKLLLNSHAHYDHAGGLAAVQTASGAPAAASGWSARALAAGASGVDDPQYGSLPAFPAVRRVRVIADGEAVRVGPLALTAHATLGHTPGGTSWTWTSCEGTGTAERCLALVYADSQTPVSADGFSFTQSSAYPTALQDFARGQAALERLPCDVLITPHPEASGLWARVAARGAGQGDALVDRGACRNYAAAARQQLARRVAAEGGTR